MVPSLSCLSSSLPVYTENRLQGKLFSLSPLSKEQNQKASTKHPSSYYIQSVPSFYIYPFSGIPVTLNYVSPRSHRLARLLHSPY